jgi:hypothetical protein
MTPKEIAKTIVTEMTDETVARYCIIYLKNEKEDRKTLTQTLLAQNMLDEALALAIIKNWTADGRIFFYTLPQTGGGHMAYMGLDGNEFNYDVTEDSEYWALAHVLALSIKDILFPVQEDVTNKEFDSNDEEIESLQDQLDSVMRENGELVEKNREMRRRFEDMVKGLVSIGNLSDALLKLARKS